MLEFNTEASAVLTSNLGVYVETAVFVARPVSLQ